MKRNRVDIITMGCSKNLVDSERLMRQFQLNGYSVVHNARRVNGEIVVVNTCAFIQDAREESIGMILSLIAAKKRGYVGQLYVMGCLSERYRGELEQELPEVDKFYGKFDWSSLFHDIGKSYYRNRDSERALTTPRHYAYLKVAEGCNRKCAYCSIPVITGQYRSRPMDEILAEAGRLVKKGVKEIQLIAQDLTYYGIDLARKCLLPELTERLADIRGVEWIRLHYGYPSNFPYDILRVMQEQENVCRYLDIALQHISDPMLRQMRRGITKQATLELIERIREEVPEIHLRTTLMVGHPGETEQDFEELLQFVRDVRFERLGAFAYSHEADTYAYAHYRDEIPAEVKQKRLDELMCVQETISRELNEAKIGRTFKTMIDGEDEMYYIGRTEFDSPEVDQEVLILKNQPLLIGEFYNIDIEHIEAFEMYGKMLN